MIEIEFINSPDKEILGKYKYFLNQIRLGNSPRSNLIIDDPLLRKLELILKVGPESVSVQETNNQFYHSNGKKITGKKLHYQGDQLSFGDTSFKIVSFELDQDYPLEQQLAARVNEDPNLKPVFISIQEELMQLDRDEEL